MSKSKKNVIDPHTMIEKYGADTTRLFCLFAAPPERDLEWSEAGVEGGYRFLSRVWRLIMDYETSIKNVEPFHGEYGDLEGPVRELYKKAHQTIRKVTIDIEERFHFNTVISAVMELVNKIAKTDIDSGIPTSMPVMRFAIETVIRLLAPIVPHFTEEIWSCLGYTDSILDSPWPIYEEDAMADDNMVIVIQVNGKLRSKFETHTGTESVEIERKAVSDERIQKFIEGKSIKKVIIVKNKLVNIVV